MSTLARRVLAPLTAVLLAVGLLAGGLTAPAVASPALGDTAASFKMTVKVQPKKKRVVAGAEKLTDFQTMALMYKPKAKGKWRVVAKRKGRPDLTRVRLVHKDAKKGFYRLRLTGDFFICGSNSCGPEKRVFVSKTVRLK
ncbi:hypothetical protein [Nocardioides massiliensis]|uniref:Uncharacterized protein n=1 Tax=Nocardioides massiliensis TaxID=1325935 RepID=A0ABT9NKZ3_9ACTN|nr:hypothetical protein [Nocardioides massiliensis]MDP9821073.1 hypothetical protein [Nocardioides massiliensis]